LPNDRRAFIPGGTYFFTVKTELNAPMFGELAAVRLLGIIIREATSVVRVKEAGE